MKKLVGYLVVFFSVFCIYGDVFAQPYQLNEAIDVGREATIESEMFTYANFSYSPLVDDKGNGIINFSTITNKTNSKLPVSISIALFDINGKNIGHINYCSDKDFGGVNEDFELGGNQSSPFKLIVTSKYLIEGAKASDVKQIVVLGDNKYCQIGGSTKYQGLTIDEVTAGKVAAEKTSRGVALDLFFFLKDKSFLIITVFLVSLIIGLAIQGVILNALHKRMFATTTAMAYLPILNTYISVKLSFGSIIAKIYLVAFFGSIVFILLGMSFITVIVNFIGGISFFIVIFKLISKKYNLFYFEPVVKNNLDNNHAVFGATNRNVVDNNVNSNVNNTIIPESNNLVDLNYNDSGNEMVDLSISDNSMINNGISHVVSNNSTTNIDNSISIGGSSNNNSLNNSDVNINSLNNNLNFNSSNIDNNNNNKEESDLSKFFK